MLYLGISDTHEAQVHILQALTRNFRLDPTLSINRLAEKCPLNYTGADFYALCSDALLVAMSRKANEVDKTISTLLYVTNSPFSDSSSRAEPASDETSNSNNATVSPCRNVQRRIIGSCGRRGF
jgi:SpoVK/Ycf46/Vps4 family AAA+-type ATPase